MTYKKTDYHYTECGLDNVMIIGMPVLNDDAGEDVISIPNIYSLHKQISTALVTQECALRPAELRFLRTELGMTQAELAKLLRLDAQTVGRWERGECQMDAATEMVIRFLAIEKLQLEVQLSTEEIAEKCLPRATGCRIAIDGSDPSNYRPQAA